MDLLTIRELYKDQEKYLDQEITIGGWVRSIRDSKTFGFFYIFILSVLPVPSDLLYNSFQ